MGALAVLPIAGFVESVQELIEKVDYRRAETPEQKEEIFRLRYEAYREEGAIEANLRRSFSDRFDALDNARIIGLYYEGELVSSIRLSISTPESPDLPALGVFPDILEPEITAGKTIIDPTRFVVAPRIARAVPKISYATVRLGWMACEYFQADLVLATVRVEHQAFYRRMFGHRPMCDARPYPTLKKPISLMGLEYPDAREKVHQRYPFFRSTYFERRMLFEHPAPGAATAREVLRPEMPANA
jgi:N-acyl-L-homoserine lactone synthetase